MVGASVRQAPVLTMVVIGSTIVIFTSMCILVTTSLNIEDSRKFQKTYFTELTK